MGAVRDLYASLLRYVERFLRTAEARQEVYSPELRENYVSGTSTLGEGESLDELISEYKLFGESRRTPWWKWVGTGSAPAQGPAGPDQHGPDEVAGSHPGWEYSPPHWHVGEDEAAVLEAAAQKVDVAIGRAKAVLGPGGHFVGLGTEIRAGMTVWCACTVHWAFFWEELQAILRDVREKVGQAKEELDEPALPDWRLEPETLAHAILGARAWNPDAPLSAGHEEGVAPPEAGVTEDAPGTEPGQGTEGRTADRRPGARLDDWLWQMDALEKDLARVLPDRDVYLCLVLSIGGDLSLLADEIHDSCRCMTNSFIEMTEAAWFRRDEHGYGLVTLGDSWAIEVRCGRGLAAIGDCPLTVVPNRTVPKWDESCACRVLYWMERSDKKKTTVSDRIGDDLLLLDDSLRRLFWDAPSSVTASLNTSMADVGWWMVLFYMAAMRMHPAMTGLLTACHGVYPPRVDDLPKAWHWGLRPDLRTATEYAFAVMRKLAHATTDHLHAEPSGIVGNADPIVKGEDASPAEVEVDFVEKDDGWHWVVDDEDKGKFAQDANRKIAKISLILLNQIGLGWVPHQTFINHLGWDSDEYFQQDRMQKHLSILRRKLGVTIEYQKDHGVRFGQNVVKAKTRAK